MFKIIKSFLFAARWYRAETRVDGGKYIWHAVRVARILRAEGENVNVVCAGMLCEVLERTSTTALELKRRFGPEVTRLVAGVSPSYYESYDECLETAKKDEDMTKLLFANEIVTLEELEWMSPRHRAFKKTYAQLSLEKFSANVCVSAQLYHRYLVAIDRVK